MAYSFLAALQVEDPGNHSASTMRSAGSPAASNTAASDWASAASNTDRHVSSTAMTTVPMCRGSSVDPVGRCVAATTNLTPASGRYRSTRKSGDSSRHVKEASQPTASRASVEARFFTRRPRAPPAARLRVAARSHVQLAEDRRQLALHGSYGDHECRGDVPVRLTGRRALRNAALRCGQCGATGCAHRSGRVQGGSVEPGPGTQVGEDRGRTLRSVRAARRWPARRWAWPRACNVRPRSRGITRDVSNTASARSSSLRAPARSPCAVASSPRPRRAIAIVQGNGWRVPTPVPATQDRLLTPWAGIASRLGPHPAGLALFIAEQAFQKQACILRNTLLPEQRTYPRLDLTKRRRPQR